MAARKVPEKVVRAADLVPSAFGAGGAGGGPSAAGLGVTKPDDLTYDLAYLVAVDTHPVDPEAAGKPGKRMERYLRDLTRDNAQLLARQLFALPNVMTEHGPTVELPDPVQRLPRRLPVPKARPPTRWEKFAREKGIKNRKKSRMVWDEDHQEWRPRWGYKRANDEGEHWVIDAKPGDAEGGVDPFARRRLEKEQRVIKNRLQQLRNAKNARGRRGAGGAAGGAGDGAAAAAAVPAGIPAQLTMAEGDVSGPSGGARRKRGRPVGEAKAVKGERLRMAQVATASGGLFDKSAAGEPRKVAHGRTRRRMDVMVPAEKERSRDLDVLRKVVHGTGEGDPHAAKTPKSTSTPVTGALTSGRTGKKGRRGKRMA